MARQATHLHRARQIRPGRRRRSVMIRHRLRRLLDLLHAPRHSTHH
jgi:hypothetical protein